VVALMDRSSSGIPITVARQVFMAGIWGFTFGSCRQIVESMLLMA
jgi:hypothetical protein